MQPWVRLKLLSVGLITCLSVNSAWADNLQQAVDQTIATHPQILSTESLQEAASEDIQQQKGGYYPSFDISTADGKQTSDNPATRAAAGNGNPITLTRQESHFLLSQLLFDGGNVLNRVAKSKADYQTSTYQVYETQEALGYDAALAYLTVMQDRELLKIAQLNVSAHQDMYQKIGKRVQAGAGKRSDLDLAESRLALAKSNYLQTWGQLQNDEATYIKVIGSQPGSYLEMPPQPQNIPLTLIQAQQLAVQLNPTLAASKSQVASNVAAVGIAKSAFFPTVTVDLSASFSDSLDGVPGYNNDRQALIRMNYNLFHGGSDSAAVSAARYRVIAAEQDTKKLQRDIMETVAFAWWSMQASIKRIPELKVHSLQSYNVWQAYIKQFQLGQRTLFDLLNSQSEYYNAQSALVQAQYQERISRYQLLAAIGELVSTVKNPGFTREPTSINYPNSTIKKINITLPSEIGNAATSSNDASAAWTYPADNSSSNTKGVAPKANTTSPIVIPSLEMPSSLKNKQNNKNNNASPGVLTPADNSVSQSVTGPSAPSNSAANNSSSGNGPTLLMKNEHSGSGVPGNQVEGYHLQLIASLQKSDLERYVKKHHLAVDNTSIGEHIIKKQTWYVLSYGNYPTRKAARIAQQDLVAQLHVTNSLIIKNNPEKMDV